jgi:hypothetical protein
MPSQWLAPEDSATFAVCHVVFPDAANPASETSRRRCSPLRGELRAFDERRIDSRDNPKEAFHGRERPWQKAPKVSNR